MANEPRRTFLKQAGAGAAALAWGGAMGAAGANEKAIVGLIGCGGRGSGVAKGMGGAHFVCDPDGRRLAATAKRFGVKPERAVADMRRLFDEKSVDAVIVATPDHWHVPASLLAVAAGKHVYVEKPASHNFRESQLLVEAARRHKRVVQHGTQSRSSEMIAGAMQMLREGLIGDVLVSKAWNIQRRANIGHAKPSPVPKGIDYDTWVGPAELVPYQSNRFHYKWHWWYNFGTGDMGNDGVHEIDYALWGLGVDGLPSSVAGLGTKLFFDDDQEFPDTQTVVFEWPADGKVGHKRQLIFEMRIWSPTRPYGIDNGAEFYGTNGRLALSKRGWIDILGPRNRKIQAKPKTPPKLIGNHQQDFISAVKTGRKPNADIAIGHRSVALVHLGNIACRLGRSLSVNPKTETIVGDDEAARLLARTYRKGGHWAVPKGV